MGTAFQKLCEGLGLSLPLENFPKTLIELDRLKIKAEPVAFKELVKDWLASLKVEGDSRRFQAGAVTAGSIMELRLIRFRAVFAPGMQSRSFPAPAGEDSILLDHERKALNRLFNAPDALSEKRKRPVEDRLLFALIAQAATEKLVFTYSRTDEQGGKERLPSPFLVTAAGAVYCWGNNRDGELGDGTTARRAAPVRVGGGHAFVRLGVGSRHACGLTAQGQAYCWGGNTRGQLGDGTLTSRTTPVPVHGGHTYADLFLGSSHTCALTPAGEAFCWGANDQGQTGDQPTDFVEQPVLVELGQR